MKFLHENLGNAQYTPTHIAQDFRLSSMPAPYLIRGRRNRRIASYETISTTQKADKKTSKVGGCVLRVALDE